MLRRKQGRVRVARALAGLALALALLTAFGLQRLTYAWCPVMQSAAWSPCCGEQHERAPAPTDEIRTARCCEQREFDALAPALTNADRDLAAEPAVFSLPVLTALWLPPELPDPLDHGHSGLSPPLRRRLSTLRAYLL